uniref:Agouti-related protein n=1 Tax=Podarcis muralis TaxID=64176 RepID=A0A670IM47_PODMU
GSCSHISSHSAKEKHPRSQMIESGTLPVQGVRDGAMAGCVCFSFQMCIFRAAEVLLAKHMLLTALQTQGREERSPRRCVRLQESCLGHKLPCCDPCATCYCRFFNANCFCKKFSNTFPCGKN